MAFSSNNHRNYTNTRRKTTYKKKYIIIATAIVIIFVIAAFIFIPHKVKTKVLANTPNVSNSATTTHLAAAESGLLPWQLQAPLSRMAVFPGTSPNQLTLMGGYTAQGSSSAGVYSLNTTNGALKLTSNLKTTVHDAANSTLNGQMMIFGGGVTNSVNTAQIVSPTSGTISTASMPQLRSDATAVTIGNTTYIIGGYNGKSADAQVLTTTNGKTFKTFGNLPVPVRYAAAAAQNGKIYVFGGLAVSGSNAGQPLNVVQIINPASHTISLASWKMPLKDQGAMAVTINNEIFFFGGQSNVVQNRTLGVGTTQVRGIQTQGTDTVSNIWAVNPSTGQFLNAGQLQVPISNAGVTVVGNTAWIVGGESNGKVTAVVQMIKPNIKFGVAGTSGAGSPYYGYKLMIADRGNNRILVMNSAMQVTWRYPSPSLPKPNINFYFPDDAFFANHGTEIITNQENNNTIIKISYPGGKINWTYGHPLKAGSAPGYLRAPDDAYQLKNGQVVVADDQNCRILFINPNKTIAHQIGHAGVCTHNPGVSIASPNGDTPLYDGNILVSEILGSWVTEYTPTGKAVWSVHLPIKYPSDPQQIGASPGHNPNLYLIADYSNPGAIITFNRQGQVLSRYQPTSGPGRLNSPSLVEMVPSGVYMLNDDHRDRMVAIDPTTGALVWQYGVSDTPGSATGMLNKVDGFDLLGPHGSTPTHGATG